MSEHLTFYLVTGLACTANSRWPTVIVHTVGSVKIATNFRYSSNCLICVLCGEPVLGGYGPKEAFTLLENSELHVHELTVGNHSIEDTVSSPCHTLCS